MNHPKTGATPDHESVVLAQGPQFLSRSCSSRMSVPEIADRLSIGRQAVYRMLEQRIIPGIRVGHRWIVTRYAYERWERGAGSPGLDSPATLQ